MGFSTEEDGWFICVHGRKGHGFTGKQGGNMRIVHFSVICWGQHMVLGEDVVSRNVHLYRKAYFSLKKDFL